MTDTTASTSSATDGQSSDSHPPSWYAFALTVLLLLAAALALAIADVGTANTIAGLAYYALAVGVALRFAEYAHVRERATVTIDRARPHLEAQLERWPTVRSATSRSADLARTATRRASATVQSSTLVDADLEDGIRLAIPFTVVAGLAIVGRWWLDPARTVSVVFLAGWAFALIVLVWLSVIVPELRRTTSVDE